MAVGYVYTWVGKHKFTVVRVEKGLQVMMITTALVTRKNVTVQL